MDAQIKTCIENYQAQRQIIDQKQEFINSLNDHFQKIITSLNNDLNQSKSELEKSNQNINIKLTMLELTKIISKAYKINYNKIYSYLNYEQTIWPDSKDVFSHTPLIINCIIYNKKNKKILFKTTYTAHMSDIQNDNRTLYNHTIIKFNKEYEYAMINIQKKEIENLIITIPLTKLDDKMCSAILYYLDQKKKILTKK